jgi:hypothetical protein
MVLKVRRVGGREVLSLFDEQAGATALPRDWTDQGDEGSYSKVLEQPAILHGLCLLKLSQLVQVVKKGVDDER